MKFSVSRSTWRSWGLSGRKQNGTPIEHQHVLSLVSTWLELAAVGLERVSDWDPLACEEYFTMSSKECRPSPYIYIKIKSAVNRANQLKDIFLLAHDVCTPRAKCQ